MKHIIIALVVLLCSVGTSVVSVRANAIVDIESNNRSGSRVGSIIAPFTMKVNTVIRDQFAVTTITQQYRLGHGMIVRRIGMPLSAERCVTGLRYRLDDGKWRVATIGRRDSLRQGTGVGTPQLPPSNEFTSYMQRGGLTYDVLDSIGGDYVMELECTIMELLPLTRGIFSYQVPCESLEAVGVKHVAWSLSLVASTALRDVILPHSIVGTMSDSACLTVPESLVPTGQSMMFYRMRRDDLSAIVLSAKPKNDDGYALLFATPGDDTTFAIPRRFTIVIDVSGSMSGQKINEARDGAQKCLDQLAPQDEFDVVLFDSNVLPLWTTHRPANTANIAEARAFIDAVNASGGTNLEQALSRTFGLYADTSTVNVAVFLTDGQASVNRPLIVQRNTKNVRLFVLGVGADVDEALLRALASDHRGQYFGIANASGLSEAIVAISEGTRMPLIMDPTMTCAPSVLYDVAPSVLPNIYANEQFMIAARYRQPGEIVATVAGKGVDGAIKVVIQGELADNDTLAPYVPKMWGKLRIDLLVSLLAGTPKNSRLWTEYRDEIISLGVKFGLVTPYTSFTGVSDGTTYVSEEDVADVSRCRTCALATPNPVRSSTTITTTFVGAHDAVYIRLIGINGEIVLETIAPGCTSGEWAYTLDLQSLSVSLAAGTYMLQIVAGDEMRTVSMHVVR